MLLGSAGSNNDSKYAINKELKLEFLNSLDSSSVEQLKTIFSKHKGESKVIFQINTGNSKKIVETDFRIANSSFLITELKARLGGSIKIL